MIGWLIVGALVWLALACPVAVLIGRGIREADRREEVARPAEEDLLADQPAEILTPAGIDARFRQIAPSTSTRSWTA